MLKDGKENLRKFDARSDEAIFLGYVPTSKAYKVFNQRTRMYEESIHVVFDEGTFISSTSDTPDPFLEDALSEAPSECPQAPRPTALNPLAPPFTSSIPIACDSDSDNDVISHSDTISITSPPYRSFQQ